MKDALLEQPALETLHRPLDRLMPLMRPHAHHDELVPPDPRQQIAAAQGRRQLLRHGDQQLVPRLVTVGVVDLLEAIEIDKGDEHRVPGPLRQGKQASQLLHQRPPVRQAGQGIAEGLARQLLVGLLQLLQQLLPLHMLGDQPGEEADELL
ncbi:hypothetical protein D3C75_536930 [compost metagenome]